MLSDFGTINAGNSSIVKIIAGLFTNLSIISSLHEINFSQIFLNRLWNIPPPYKFLFSNLKRNYIIKVLLYSELSFENNNKRQFRYGEKFHK